jgi:cysteinyl-tRNA synthetase
MFCFTAHYRSPLSFSWEGLRASAHSLSNLYQAISSIPSSDKPVSQQEVDSVLGDFFEAVCDDLNMPRAMAAFWSVLKDEKIDPAVKSECVKRADQILALGLTEVPKENVINLSLSSETPAEKQNLPSEYPSDLVQRIGERLRARASRDYKTADLIRDELTNLGITIKDLPDGGVECSSSKSTRKVVIKR